MTRHEASCPKTHTELGRGSSGKPYGHCPGHQYWDVDVTISVSRSGRYQVQAVEVQGSSQGSGCDQEHGRLSVVGRGDSIQEAASDAETRAGACGLHKTYFVAALDEAVDEAYETLDEAVVDAAGGESD